MNTSRRLFIHSLCLLFALAGGPALLAQDAVKPYAQKNSKEKTYYLFTKEVELKNGNGKRNIYYFAKDPANKKGKPLAKVPEGYKVSETKNGLLVLKRADAPAKKKPKE